MNGLEPARGSAKLEGSGTMETTETVPGRREIWTDIAIILTDKLQELNLPREQLIQTQKATTESQVAITRTLDMGQRVT